MSNRSAKSVAALFASVMAGANLATVTEVRAQATQPAADNCLAAPKDATPAGSHWYYRIDRVTKRQCWYLREEGERVSDKSATRATPPASPPATSTATAEPAAQQPPTTITRKAIADARAEWISQQSRAEQNSRTTGAAVPAPVVADDKRAMGANVLAPTPLATTRLFEGAGANASGNPAGVRTAAVADPRANQAQAEPVQQSAVQEPAWQQPALQQPALQQPALQQPALQQQPAPAIPYAAPDSSATKPTASLQMLLVVIAAALALAGITVSLVFRLGRIRARRAMRRHRKAMWDSAKAKRSAPPTSHREEARTRRAEAPHRPRQEAKLRPRPEVVYHPRQEATHRPRQEPAHHPRPHDARERQVTDMLARLARSAQP